MARVKIKLADNIARVVFIETDATNGATLGTNLFLPDGSVATPSTLASWMGVSTSTGTLAHRLLAGLRLGNDHPQYPLKAGTETITGQWDFTQQIRGASGSAAAPLIAPTSDTNSGLYGVGADNIGLSTAGVLRWDVNTARVAQTLPHHININTSPGTEVSAFQINDSYTGAGVEITVFSTTTPTPPANDGGIQIGLWEGPGRPPGSSSAGYRWRMLGDVDSAADLVFYSHNGSASGTEIYRHERDRAQMFFANGTAALPTISFAGSTNSGMLWNTSAGALEWSTGGTARANINGTRFRIVPPIYLSSGSGASPALSFNSNTNDGIYQSATNIVNFVTNGSTRMAIQNASVQITVPMIGANGTAANPTYSWSGDSDNGMYLTATANTVGFSTAGVVRFQIGAAGQLGIGGATYGTAGQALLSGGASAAPTWGNPALVAANFANPTASIGLTAVNGSALTAMRSDAAPALDVGISPTWTGVHQFSQNVGVNTSPNAWGSGYRAIDIQPAGLSFAGSSYTFNMTCNMYNDNVNWNRVGAAFGSAAHTSFNGDHFFYGDGAGAVGAFTPTLLLSLVKEGPARFTDGAVSPPSISFINDTDTGRCRIGSNNMADVCGGVKILDISSTGLAITGTVTTSDTAFLHRTTGTLANGAGAAAGTLLNAPGAGNPTKWIPIDDNGTTRYIPAW